MPTLATILVFFLAALILCIVPGPDMLYIIARSTGQGRSAGVASALGIALVGVLQTTAVACGLASIFLLVPTAYTIIKYVGAAYLVYLGVRAILSREAIGPEPKDTATSRRKVFLQGTLTTLLNPKVAIFYVVFLPQFVSQARGSVTLQLIVLGLLFNLTGLAVDTTVALLSGLLGAWLKRRASVRKLLGWLTGCIFIGLGVRLAVSQQQ